MGRKNTRGKYSVTGVRLFVHHMGKKFLYKK